MAASSWPSYLELLADGRLQLRAERAVEALEACHLCPRSCGANRLAGQPGFCRTGRHAIVASAFPHFGEEDCLRGSCGSGTVFFAHCGLTCVFCQNYDISWAGAGAILTGRQISELMLELQRRGCHNINLVTPAHVVPQVLEAVLHAASDGLSLPLVYNTSGYDSPLALELLDGVVDVYMPDFKLWSRERARRWLRAPDYPAVARRALVEMHRQVGDLVIGPDGTAVRGLLVRHLIMPDSLHDTREIMAFLSRELSPRTYVNLMAQYHPAGRVGLAGRYRELGRRVWASEVEAAYEVAREAGLSRFDGR